VSSSAVNRQGITKIRELPEASHVTTIMVLLTACIDVMFN